MIFHKFWILRENRTLVRCVAVGFQSHQPFLARPPKQLVHHFQCFQIAVFAELRSPKRSGNSSRNAFKNVDRIADEHGADGSATDNDRSAGWSSTLKLPCSI